MYQNISGINNCSFGAYSLHQNTGGTGNNALGNFAMYQNNGSYNNAFGYKSLYSTTTGTGNNGMGFNALYTNDIGFNNVGIGDKSGYSLLSGNYNTFVGANSGYSQSSGSNNTFIGNNSGTGATGNNLTNITCLGANSPAIVSNSVVLGNSSIQYLYSYQSLTNLSDKRDKINICKSDLGLNLILNLNPVNYNLKPRDAKEYSDKIHHGLIAQELEETINKMGIKFGGFVEFKNRELLAINYQELIAPIIKSIQELNKKINGIFIILLILQFLLQLMPHIFRQ